jgi:hypothetical protein
MENAAKKRGVRVNIEERKYSYKAFGLNLQSDYILDGLLPSDGPIDVYIVEGKVPVVFTGPAGSNAYWAEGKEKFAFRVSGMGSFMISYGTEIIVEKGESSDAAAYTLFILGTCMGALLLQRGLVPIHGSALSLKDKEIIITGHSGAGKSTLTAALNKKGYSFLADDIAALHVEENGEPWIMPAFPKQKLWRDTAIHLYGSIDSLERIPGIRDKFHVPMASQFITTKRKLRALFEISIHSHDQVELAEVKGSEKLSIILRNTYRFEMIDVKGISAQHFQQCSQIAAHISVFTIKRPETGYSVEEQIDAILNVLDSM